MLETNENVIDDIFDDDETTTQPIPATTDDAKGRAKSKVAPTETKVFSRTDIVRHVEVNVSLPELYAGYEPWRFKLRLKMSSDAEERRQEYMALTPTEMTLREGEQNLDELCDLLVELPKGFSDLQDLNNGPGPSFKSYVTTTENAEAKELLFSIVKGAIMLYWRKISPQEFRKKV